MKSKSKALITFLTLALLLGVASYAWWRNDAPRRHSLASLAQLDAALHSGKSSELLDLLVLPAAVRGRSAPEQSGFLAKALNDEVSPAGLAVLRRQGTFGPLKELFPAEAQKWAAQADVNADDCVAFKLERPGVRAEAVLLKPLSPDAPYRIIRLNNVKQLAELNLSSMEKAQ